MLTPGCTVGNIRIGKLLGRGAMGEVYSGEQVTLKRQVAIKRIASHLADDPEIIQRFAREAQCVAMINSPNVVAVYEFGQFIDEQNDSHYLIVMELVDGGYDLKSCIGTDVTWQQASCVIMQVADGLIAAAEHDVIHRDIKPDNIMLSKKGVAKLADFGLAKNVDSTAMTMEGTLMGTPNYMPPEACRGESVDGRGDIYSLGATWYHLISGMPLFTAANTMALLRAHCDEEPKPLREVVPDIPEEVDNFILSCVAKDMDARPDAAAVYKFLQGTQGVPQKVPELVRIATAAKEANANSGSTMATVKQAMPGGDGDQTVVDGDSTAAEVETMVTGQYQQQDQSATATAVASPEANTLMGDTAETSGPATSSPPAAAAQSGSKLPLVLFVVVLLAGAATAGVVFSSDDSDDRDDTDITQQSPTDDDDTKITPTVNVEQPEDKDTGDQQQDASDVSGMVKNINEAIAARQFTQAQADYDRLAAQSDEYTALQTQIQDGQQRQQELRDELKVLSDKQSYALLGTKLEAAAAYPELKQLCEHYQAAADTFDKQVLADLAKVQTLVDQKHWHAAFTALNAVPPEAAAIGDDALKQRTALKQQIDLQLSSQNDVDDKLRQLHVQKHYAALSSALPEARPFPELQTAVRTYKDAINAFDKKMQTAVSAVEAAIAQKMWDDADSKLAAVPEEEPQVGKELLQKRSQLAQHISGQLDEQKKVAASLKAIHDKGQFAVLERALSRGDDYPELKTTLDGYRKAIAGQQAAIAADIKAVETAAAQKDFATARNKLEAIGEDPLVIGKEAVVQVSQLKDSLRTDASAAVDAAVDEAVAGLEEGTKAGYTRSVKALRGAVPAAQLSGRIEELNEKILKLAEIIEKRSQE